MGYEDFKIGFWHPFGPHGRETPEAIIDRKQNEINANGWTLWSFQFRHTLDAWYREILALGEPSVFVFCSDGKKAVDPDRAGSSTTSINCERFRFVGASEWQPLPPLIKVPHPFRPGKTTASAFLVQRIHYPLPPFVSPPVEWFSENTGPWSASRFSTRGETMIRAGGDLPMRAVRAVLELKRPYLAWVGIKPKDTFF